MSVDVIFLLGRPVTTTSSLLAPISSRERREERRSLSGPPAFFAPSAAPDDGIATSRSSLYRPGGSPRKVEARETR